MPENRYFKECSLEKDMRITLQGTEHHHLFHVMRRKKGDRGELVNGKGILAEAEIVSIERKKTELNILSILQKETAPKYPLILVQAIPRLNRLDIILEKSTELGAFEIWLFPGEKSEHTRLTTHQLQRMESKVIAAMKQCGRLFFPKIIFKPQLKEWHREDFTKNAYFGDLDKTAPSFHKIWEKPQEEICFFIGPEAGFSEGEIMILNSNGVKGVSLHSNILRTDTAPIVALSLLTQMSANF